MKPCPLVGVERPVDAQVQFGVGKMDVAESQIAVSTCDIKRVSYQEFGATRVLVWAGPTSSTARIGAAIEWPRGIIIIHQSITVIIQTIVGFWKGAWLGPPSAFGMDAFDAAGLRVITFVLHEAGPRVVTTPRTWRAARPLLAWPLRATIRKGATVRSSARGRATHLAYVFLRTGILRHATGLTTIAIRPGATTVQQHGTARWVLSANPEGSSPRVTNEHNHRQSSAEEMDRQRNVPSHTRLIK